MRSLNTICQNMKLKLAKNDKKNCHFLELLGDRLEVCVSVSADDKIKVFYSMQRVIT